MAPTPADSSDSRLELVRDLVVSAGLEVLDRDGLGLRPESVSYARVFGHMEAEYDVRVSRGSVHGRIWASHQDYVNEVLAVAARYSSPYEDSPAMHAAVVHILSRLDEAGLQGRARVLAFCRVAGRLLLLGYLDSDRFRRFQSIKAASRTVDDDRAGAILRAAVQDNADGNQSERVRTFAFMFKALGMRPRSELQLDEHRSIDILMTIVQALVTGAHLDHNAGFTAMAAKVETDLSADADHPWTYFSFGFLAAIDALFELDPDFSTDQVDYDQEINRLSSEYSKPTPPDLRVMIDDRPRRSRSELKEQVLAAGVELLLRDGLGLRPEALSYSTVFAHIEETKNMTVHRSTVHQRLWSNQEEFRSEVLAEAARYHTEESLHVAKQAMATQTVVRNPDDTVNVRQLILDSTLAIVSAQMQVSANSTIFRRWQSIKASMLPTTTEGEFAPLRQAVSERYEELIAVFADTYRETLPLVGLKVNPDLKMSEDQVFHLFSVIGATITSGADYNISAGATLMSRTVPVPRADGSGQCDEWPIQAFATLGFLDLFFVPVDQ